GSAAATQADIRLDEFGLVFDLHAQLDHAVRRDAEELGGGPAVAREEHEEQLSPVHHAHASAGNERRPAEVVGHVVQRLPERVAAAAPDDAADVRRLHEAIVRSHAVKAEEQRLDLEAAVFHYFPEVL